jgi:hypothetical protein
VKAVPLIPLRPKRGTADRVPPCELWYWLMGVSPDELKGSSRDLNRPDSEWSPRPTVSILRNLSSLPVVEVHGRKDSLEHVASQSDPEKHCNERKNDSIQVSTPINLGSPRSLHSPPVV